MAVGAVGSVFTALHDLGNGIFEGDWSFNTTKSLWSKGIMPVVGYDWTSAVFDGLYKTKLMQSIEENAYGPFKRDGGVVYKVGKKVGYYVGVAVATYFTFGGGGLAIGATQSATTTLTGAVVSSLPTAMVTATAKLGSAAQENYNTAVDKKALTMAEEELKKAGIEVTDENLAAKVAELKAKGIYLEGGEIGKVLLTSAGQSAVEGAFVLAGASAGKYLKGVKSLAGNKLLQSTIKNGIVSTKSFASEGIRALSTGDDYNFEKAAVDSVSSFVVSMAGDTVANKVGDLYDKHFEVKKVGSDSKALGDIARSVDVETRGKVMEMVKNIEIDPKTIYKKGAKSLTEELIKTYVTKPIENEILNAA